jgi:tRNA nucleotidyltransferase (CCA-adding enzyme)
MSDHRDFAEALAAAYPELAAVAAAAPDPVYLVGGAVRDLLLGRGRADIDLVVEGDPAALAAALGAEPVAEHPRFGTLKIELGGDEVDIAATRRETYAEPGALPTVELGAPIRTDLARRDFTVNAMAVPLAEPRELIDPYGGQEDLECGALRVIHGASFVDDPTRAIRAARYAARFGFGLEQGTEELIQTTDLGTVTPERRGAELRRLAEEATAVKGLELLAGWGLVHPRSGGGADEPGGPQASGVAEGPARADVGQGASGLEGSPSASGPFALALAVDLLMASPPWAAEADRADAILAAALGPEAGEGVLASAHPPHPSEGVALARGHDAVELVLARAAGATWLDDWRRWREVTLEISGDDLTAAGLSGPAIGEALSAALAAKLDGNAPTRADELRVALASADTNR